jgi:hypothetical protein
VASRRELVCLVITVIVAAALATIASGCGSGKNRTSTRLAGKCRPTGLTATRAVSSPFYVATSEVAPDWQGLIGSDGRRYSVPDVLGPYSTATRGAFSADRAIAVGGYPAHYPVKAGTKWLARVVDIGGSSSVVSTEAQTAAPVFGPHGEIAYALGSTIHYLGGPTIRARGLPKGAMIIKLELSPQHLISAALVAWGAGEKSAGNEALCVISPDGSRRVVSDLDASSEQPDPVWNPNGDEIAFVRQVRAQDGIVFVIRSDGSGLKRISHSERAFGPVWSPDGKQLAFTQFAGFQPLRKTGHAEVYVADLHGHE